MVQKWLRSGKGHCFRLDRGGLKRGLPHMVCLSPGARGRTPGEEGQEGRVSSQTSKNGVQIFAIDTQWKR